MSESSSPAADTESAETTQEAFDEALKKAEEQELALPQPDEAEKAAPTDSIKTEDQSDPGELPATRRRDSLLWVWPLVVIATMAVLGRFLGSYAALIGGITTVGILVAVMSAGIVKRRTHAMIGAVVGIVIVAVGFVFGREFFDDDQRGDAPQEVRTAAGDMFTIEELRDGAVRGAVLTGLVVDDLDLTRAELDGIVASRASMQDTVLREADLAGADLHGGDLRFANLHGADLRGTDLHGADLSNADLSSACLRGANLLGATLDNADFTGAAVTEATVDKGVHKIAKNWGTASTATCA